MVSININDGKCTGCGVCVSTCPVGMYELDNGKAKVVKNVEDCVLCRVCETSCPSGAIEVIE